MRDDSGTPKIFVGFDGHVFLAHGENRGWIYLPWHQTDGVVLREERVQALPSHLQQYPPWTLRGWARLHYRLLYGFKRPRSWLRRTFGWPRPRDNAK